jgi:hypothetical protein
MEKGNHALSSCCAAPQFMSMIREVHLVADQNTPTNKESEREKETYSAGP